VAVAVAVAVKLDSRGPILFRCRRAGRHGVEFTMLKFRKMYDGARGAALTAADDDRFTRIGRLLAKTKLDELPQLINVLKGEMSLVGPRPEDPGFVSARRREFEPILAVRPGMTGLSQLAFAREADILDSDNRERDYEQRILPQKLHIDRLYTEQRSVLKDIEILLWTAAAVLFRRSVAVHRVDLRMTFRRRPTPEAAPSVQPARSNAA